MASEEKEEVLIEVEAVEAVYGDDCVILQRFPPHIHLHIKPRTADDSSQQFVEAVLELRAGLQYPKEPPQFGIIDSKGLDVARQAHLMTCIQEKVDELSSCLMLVALCEEAVQMLTHMNHPEGNCPMCLDSLLKEDSHGNLWPFMKLMSCYHCFHSKCIIKWWNWLQQQIETNTKSKARVNPSRNLGCQSGLDGTVNNQGTCPVCRKGFQAIDIEHVMNLIQTYTSQLVCTLEDTETDEEDELQKSEQENIRRKKFEALLKLQEENNGLIEPKVTQVLLPGVFLPEPITPPSISNEISTASQEISSTNRPTSETGPSRPLNKASTSSRYHVGNRKNKTRNPRKQNEQWVKKSL